MYTAEQRKHATLIRIGKDIELEYSGSSKQVIYRKDGEIRKVEDVSASFTGYDFYNKAEYVAKKLNRDKFDITIVR